MSRFAVVAVKWLLACIAEAYKCAKLTLLTTSFFQLAGYSKVYLYALTCFEQWLASYVAGLAADSEDMAEPRTSILGTTLINS